MKKKLIAALLTASMVLGMTACGSGSDGQQSSAGGSESKAEESNAGGEEASDNEEAAGGEEASGGGRY